MYIDGEWKNLIDTNPDDESGWKSTPSALSDDSLSGSINSSDLKDKGFGTGEKVSLRIDVQEADAYKAKNNKNSQQNLSLSQKKKVRSSYNEIDDGGIDDEIVRSFQIMQMNKEDASNGDTSLLDAINPSEKKFREQNEVIETTRQQQNAGRMNALLTADKMQKDAGLKAMTYAEMANKMQDAIYNPRRTTRKALETSADLQIGIKGKIGRHEEGKFVQGVKNITKVAEDRKVKGVSVQDVNKVKNRSQNKTAEMLLEKSGQTAKLAEIKMMAKRDNPHDTTQKSSKDISEKMKELLKETLSKKDKVR